MNTSESKRMKLVAILMALLALSYAGFLFLPYFRVYNAQTGQLGYSITGFSVAFGKNSSSEHIIGSNLMIIAEIAGMAGGLITLIFALWFIFSKNHSPFMYFLLGLSIPCIASAIASIFLSGPIYQNLNSIHNRVLIYSPFFFITATLTIISFLLNGFILIYSSFRKIQSK